MFPREPLPEPRVVECADRRVHQPNRDPLRDRSESDPRIE
jgi:hypothetical protein